MLRLLNEDRIWQRSIRDLWITHWQRIPLENFPIWMDKVKEEGGGIQQGIEHIQGCAKLWSNQRLNIEQYKSLMNACDGSHPLGCYLLAPKQLIRFLTGILPCHSARRPWNSSKIEMIFNQEDVLRLFEYVGI